MPARCSLLLSQSQKVLHDFALTLNSSLSSHGSALLQPQSLFSALLSPAIIFRHLPLSAPFYPQHPFAPLDLSGKEWSIPVIPVQILPYPRNLPRIPKHAEGPFLCSPLARWNWCSRRAQIQKRWVQIPALPFARCVILDKTLNFTFWGRAFFWHTETVSYLLCTCHRLAVTLKGDNTPEVCSEMPQTWAVLVFSWLFFHEKGSFEIIILKGAEGRCFSPNPWAWPSAWPRNCSLSASKLYFPDGPWHQKRCGNLVTLHVGIFGFENQEQLWSQHLLALLRSTGTVMHLIQLRVFYRACHHADATMEDVCTSSPSFRELWWMVKMYSVIHVNEILASSFPSPYHANLIC